jgi:hypothetical protein
MIGIITETQMPHFREKSAGGLIRADVLLTRVPFVAAELSGMTISEALGRQVDFLTEERDGRIEAISVRPARVRSIA